MVSTLLRVPEPLDDWLPDVGPLDELELGWDRDLDWDCVDAVDRTWDGDRVDWVDWVDWAWDGVAWDWDRPPSREPSSLIYKLCRSEKETSQIKKCVHINDRLIVSSSYVHCRAPTIVGFWADADTGGLKLKRIFNIIVDI